MNRFWKWKTRTVTDLDGEETIERTLMLNGTIAEESWFDNDVTPALFRDELCSGSGDITVWINSPGGDCFAAAQIYNMLRDYKGKVTVKIDGIAASAASVIAMAGDDVQVSPVSMLMIHNPATVAMGDYAEMQKAIEMLDGVKNSIINAYALKTGLSRNKLSKLMDEETWMDATKAVELGFADSVIARDILTGQEAEEGETKDTPDSKEEKGASMLFSRRSVAAAINQKIMDHCKMESSQAEPEAIDTDDGIKVEGLYDRLDLMKKFM